MGWKRIAKGAAIGTAVSVAGYLGGRYLALNQSDPRYLIMQEAGQRIGSVASAKWGGWAGNAAYQLVDALVDRYVNNRAGTGRFGSGTQGASFI